MNNSYRTLRHLLWIQVTYRFAPGIPLYGSIISQIAEIFSYLVFKASLADKYIHTLLEAKLYTIKRSLCKDGGEGMPREKKKRNLTQSVLFIAIFWALVALFFVGIIHLLQRID